jgi:hypothetical protein
VRYELTNRTRDIAAQLRSVFSFPDIEISATHDDSDKMSLVGKMTWWYSKAAINQELIQNPEDSFDGVKDDEDESNSFAEFSAHCNVILESAALKWLVDNLRKRSLLQWDTSTHIAVNDIRRKILEALPSEKISKRQPPRDHQVTFRLKWGHILNQQRRELEAGVTEHGNRILESGVITVCYGKAQAASVRQYLGQTWPWSWEDVFGLLQDATQVGVHSGNLANP